jgi:hypothetical protein
LEHNTQELKKSGGKPTVDNLRNFFAVAAEGMKIALEL